MSLWLIVRYASLERRWDAMQSCWTLCPSTGIGVASRSSGVNSRLVPIISIDRHELCEFEWLTEAELAARATSNPTRRVLKSGSLTKSEL